MNQQAINQSINIIFYFITLTVNSWIDFSGTDGEDPIPLHTLSLSLSLSLPPMFMFCLQFSSSLFFILQINK
jgi:hypothetical protein